MKINKIQIVITIAILTFGTFFANMAVAERGDIVALTNPAWINSDGVSRVATQGDQIIAGDVVSTGPGGNVQIMLPDETRIVIGPNSQMKMTRLAFRRNNTARRVRLNAVAGTFRFITGNSPKRAFSVRTPTATMAVRGTAFDFAVERTEQGTSLVVHDGVVRLCGSSSRCVAVPRGCQTVQIDRLRRFTQPQNQEERLAILRALFPYARGDTQLEPLFRTFVENCQRSDGDRTASNGTAEPETITKLELPADPGGAPVDDGDEDEEPRNPAE